MASNRRFAVRQANLSSLSRNEREHIPLGRGDTTMQTTAPSTIDPNEAAHFGAMAAEWWDPKGSSAMLHKLNPARLGYLRERVDAHWHGDGASYTPLAGKRVLDVGCGAGLLCEPLARLGAAVTGIDAAVENIAAARAHAALSGLAIDYRAGGARGRSVQFGRNRRPRRRPLAAARAG
eukprot:gene11903-15889_t